MGGKAETSTYAAGPRRLITSLPTIMAGWHYWALLLETHNESNVSAYQIYAECLRHCPNVAKPSPTSV